MLAGRQGLAFNIAKAISHYGKRALSILVIFQRSLVFYLTGKGAHAPMAFVSRLRRNSRLPLKGVACNPLKIPQ